MRRMDSATGYRLSKMVNTVGRAARLFFSRDQLPLDPIEVAKPQTGVSSFLAWIFKPEALEQEPEPPDIGKDSFLCWLFSKEELPQDPVEGKGRRSFLGMLLQPESLTSEQRDITKG